MTKSIRGKLAIAFGTIFLVLIIGSATNYYYLSQAEQVQNRVLNLRVKTVNAGKDINNGINYSLAALRGYMILGADPVKSAILKKQRNDAWVTIDKSIETFDQVSSNWTVPKNIEILTSLKQELSAFKLAQEQVENIAQTPENIPSYQLLLSDAAPRAGKILAALTNIINTESSLAATVERKTLLKLLADSRGSFAIALANIRAYLLSGDAQFKKKFNDKWQLNQQRLTTINNSYQHLFSQSQRQHWDDYQSVRTEFSNLPKKMFDLRAADDWNKANYLLGTTAAPRAKAALSYLSQMAASQAKLLKSDVNTLNNATQNQISILVISALASLVISFLMAFGFSNDLLQRLQPILKKSQDIAANNLSSPQLEVKGQDELAELTVAVNSMSQSLRETLRSTADSMKDVSIEANNIYTANSDMSTNITMQTEQMSLIASAIEELSASASEVSNYSVAASGSAKDSVDIAEQGGQLVHSSLGQMSEISEAFNTSANSIESLSQQSKQIEDILGVIRGIAEQTNLLALNAAIEAARAGEQGRGFAVVADEVRQLASRTTDATTDVEKAIESMRNDTAVAVNSMGVGREKVAEGIDISNKVSDILNQIIERAKDVAIKVETIATTSKQQSVVTDEIAGNTDQASSVSMKIGESINEVVAMAQGVSNNSSSRAKDLQLMINR
ncbi:MAG: methyl-accepting chemotaxis protein [Gammaproteobacteria bacterium]|nr:methyl-accepting chemotaxis protein [Gammaproteobacteria bacterium]